MVLEESGCIINREFFSILNQWIRDDMAGLIFRLALYFFIAFFFINIKNLYLVSQALISPQMGGAYR